MNRRYTLTILGILISCCLSAQWVSQSTGFSTPFRGIAHIWAVDENIAWAVAYDGSGAGAVIQEFTRTTNGGNTWTPGTIGNAADLVPSMIFGLNADTAWVLFHHDFLSGGKVMRTDNGGLSWVHQNTAIWPDSTDAYPNLIYFWNKNEGFCMGDPSYGYFEIYTTNDGGNLWVRVDSSNVPAMVSGEYGYEGKFSVIGNMVLFGTNKGRIYRSFNKGHTWDVINTPLSVTNGRIRVIEFRDSMNGIIADRANNAYVMHSTSDGGVNWTPIAPTGVVYGNDLRYIKGTPATYVSSGSAAALSGASISYDGGLTWSDISGVANTQYTALAFPNSLTGWAGQFNQSSTLGGIAKFVGSTVHVSKQELSGHYRAYPNPSMGVFYIDMPESQDHILVEVFDGHGRCVYTSIEQAGGKASIDLQLYPTGVYAVRLYANESVYRLKIVKQGQ